MYFSLVFGHFQLLKLNLNKKKKKDIYYSLTDIFFFIFLKFSNSEVESESKDHDIYNSLTNVLFFVFLIFSNSEVESESKDHDIYHQQMYFSLLF